MQTRLRATAPGGLDLDSPPMRLWQKAKQLGVWDPAAIDLSADAADWARLSDAERDVLLRLTSMFLGGEESVTLDLLPLMQVMVVTSTLALLLATPIAGGISWRLGWFKRTRRA